MAASDELNIQNNKGIITNNQSGGTNTINQEVPARLEEVGPAERDLVGGGPAASFVYPVKITKPVERVEIQAVGANVQSLQISRPAINGVASTMKTDVRKGSGMTDTGERVLFESFSGAFGLYNVLVVTTDGLPPKLGSKID